VLVSRSVLRLIVLVALGVDVFVAVGFVTGFPITMALMSWSIWYGVRGFRRSEEWGPAIAELEAIRPHVEAALRLLRALEALPVDAEPPTHYRTV